MYLQQINTAPNASNENIHKISSTGHFLTECSYLDSHYNAARRQYNKMVRSIGFHKGWSVLDAGSGNGCFIPTLSRILGNNGTIYAIDLSQENINSIKKHIDNENFACRVFADIGSITSMRYRSNSFDAIWCSNVFQYLTDREKEQTISEFYRIVRPGGLIAIKELDLSASYICPDLLVFWNIIKRMKFYTQIHSTLHTPEIAKIALQIDLEIVKHKTFLVEWIPPLKPADLLYLNAISQFFGNFALKFDLSEKELFFANRLINPFSEDYYINSKDFYWREAYAVFIFKVPINKSKYD